MDALNPAFHYAADPINSPRHRVRNNLLGTADLCPTVRRTRKLEAMIAMGLDQEARRLTEQYAPETRDLYRFFDATRQAEYLYDRIAETIREDFKEELDFLLVFDAAFTAVRNVVEMPDRRAALLVRMCLQNGGRLSQNKRKQFTELTDAEITAMEDAVAPILLSARLSD